MEIWDSGSGDLILLGSMKPWPSDPSVYQRLFERNSPRRDFELIGINSPEALWARQLASQQTAFAIAGEGPVQSDLFPILEYEAPRAFFVGTRARDMAKFDERTWQSQLAPAEKRRCLAALDGQALRAVFDQYSTINDDLGNHLLWRFAKGVGVSATFRPDWPCVFKTNPPAATQLAVDAGDEWRKLFAATAAMEKGGSEAIAGIDSVLTLLRNYGTNSDWSVSHYAGLAAKASIAIGDPQRAQQVLKAATQLRPGDAELAYVQRVASRHRALTVSQR
jgi:hypothetical protein